MPNVPTPGTGYLSSSFSPSASGSDPASNGGFKVQDLNLPGGIDDSRFATRRHVLDAVNDHFAKKEKGDGLAAMDTFYDRAYSLISSPKAREAFNIAAEPAAIRDEYGRNAAGQRMLMARRLVAAGVRFVSLQYGGWDLHAGIAAGMKTQMPAFDQAYADLIRDLDRTGLLDRTLVMVSSEFGRTPKINKDGGRDHWPKVFSGRPRRRRDQEGLRLRRLQLHGHRARARPDRPRRPGHHPLPPARDRRRQGVDGPRGPADRDRRRRQGPDRVAGLSGHAYHRGRGIGSSWSLQARSANETDPGGMSMAMIVLESWNADQKDIIRDRQERRIDRYDEVWNGVYIMSPIANIEHHGPGHRRRAARWRSAVLFGPRSRRRPGRSGNVPGCNVSDRPVKWEKNYRVPDSVVFLPGNGLLRHKRDSLPRGAGLRRARSSANTIRSRKKLGFYAERGGHARSCFSSNASRGLWSCMACRIGSLKLGREDRGA